MTLLKQSEIVTQNKIMRVVIFIIAIWLMVSCQNIGQIYPEQEVSLFTGLPTNRADTIHEMAPGFGYGAIFCQENGFISYPALYLSNDDEIFGEFFVLLGFSKITSDESDIQYVLELPVNYAQRQLNNLEIRLYPIFKPWDSNKIPEIT